MSPELFRVVIYVLSGGDTGGGKSGGALLEILKVAIPALGVITAAIIASVAGAWISHRYAEKRAADEQTAADRRHQNELEAINARHEAEMEALQRRYGLDRESAWRSHAVELTKLEIQRLLEAWKAKPATKRESILPSTMHFLAAYRDLQELNYTSPGELWTRIYTQRIAKPNSKGEASTAPHEDEAHALAAAEDEAQTEDSSTSNTASGKTAEAEAGRDAQRSDEEQ